MNLQKRINEIKQLGVADHFLPKITEYVDLLWRSNDELNLFSRQMTFDELIDNHLIDCLLVLKYFPVDLKKVADFGSGGGLPGVLFAILFPGTAFLLFEKSPKKQAFLNKCKAIAPNITVQGEIPPTFDGVDLVIARAFKPLDVILEVSRSYFLNGGRYFLLKGRREKIDEEYVLAKKKFKDLTIAIESIKSPVMEVERHLVRIR